MLAPFVIQWMGCDTKFNKRCRSRALGEFCYNAVLTLRSLKLVLLLPEMLLQCWLSSCEAIICWHKFNKFWGGWCRRRRRSRPISGGSKGGGRDFTSRNQNCSIEQGERSKGCWFPYDLWWPSWSAFWEWSNDSSDRGCGHWTSAARDWKLARNRRSRWANFVWDS